VPVDEANEPAPCDLPQHDWQQQVSHDIQYRLRQRARLAVPVSGWSADNRVERDRRVHGGGLDAHKPHADKELWRQQRATARLQRQPGQRKQHEGAGECRQMQTSVRHDLHDRVAGQLCCHAGKSGSAMVARVTG
jgi:hypothetical protein